MSIRAKRFRFRLLVAVAVGILGAAALAISVTIWWLRSDEIRDATRDTAILATVLAEQTNRAIQSIDLVQDEIREQLDNIGARSQDNFGHLRQDKNTYHSLLDRLSRLSQAAFIALIDNDGKVVVTTQKWPTPSIDISDRDYFQFFKTIDDNHIYVGRPVPDRTTGLRTIFFAKRINDANNTFLGVILVGVKLSYFQDIYNSIRSLPDQTFLMLRNDGTLILRYPDPSDRGGTKMPTQSPWYRVVSQGGGTFRSPGYFDTKARLVAVRPLSDYPIVIDVSISEAAALAGWRDHAIAIGTGALLVIVCSVFLLLALIKYIGRFLDERVKVDAALSSMLQGLVMFDSSARLVVCNQRYLDMYGLSSDIVKTGCAFDEILACRIKGHTFSADNIQAFISDLRTKLNSGATVRRFENLPDGRIISIVHHPTMDGGWVTSHEDVTDMRRAEARITYLAHHDILTGLLNREQFQERLEQSLLRVSRGEHFALLYLDLDDFKSVNDTLGHLVGDELLKTIAERLQNCLEDTDTLARLGGDEFAIVRDCVEQPSAVASLATRILEVIKAPCELGGHELTMGASIGVALAPSDGIDAAQLLKNADMAMYQAKTDGRGTFRFFEFEMDARVKARSVLEFDLRQGMMCNQFELYYQPIINLQDDTIVACEALLRWHHPQRGMISPADFISVAEDTGLINQLGEWVLRAACNEAKTWPDNIKVSVNVSPVQFKSQSLVLAVIGALADSRLPANRLELELTETALIQNEEATIAKLSQLRELGVQIALDDFGTGYSSLSYLQRVPFDMVKIDQVFIKNIPGDAHSCAIVQAIIAVSKVRNVITIAEGVEKKPQKELLRDLGCTQMQGFLFSRAVPAQRLSQFFPIRSHAASAA